MSDAAWAIGLVIVTAGLEALAAFLLLRTPAEGISQGVIGIGLLWLALGLRPEMTTRRRVLLSLLGILPLLGTLAAIALELIIERRQQATRLKR